VKPGGPGNDPGPGGLKGRSESRRFTPGWVPATLRAAQDGSWVRGWNCARRVRNLTVKRSRLTRAAPIPYGRAESG
jgi:hypothetical protein